jgi:hypothetical protein
MCSYVFIHKYCINVVLAAMVACAQLPPARLAEPGGAPRTAVSIPGACHRDACTHIVDLHLIQMNIQTAALWPVRTPKAPVL